MRELNTQSLGTISVVMPNFNDSAHIGTQLRAICEQSYQPCEVIVIDDGSSDNSIEIVEAIAADYPFVKLVRNQTNRGIIASVNRAVRLAAGDYLYVPSANDLVLPGLFERQLTLLAQHPQAAFCFTDGRSIDLQKHGRTWDITAGWLTSPGYISPSELPEITRTGKVAYIPLSHSSIFRREFLPEDEIWKPQLGCYCDWFLLQKLAFKHGCCFIPEKLVTPRWNAGGYCETTKRNAFLYRQVFMEAIKLLASAEGTDLAGFIVRGRSLLAFEPSVRTPWNVWQAIRGLECHNRQTPTLLQHVTVEYARTLFFYPPAAIVHIIRIFRDQVLIPVFCYLNNVRERALARSIHACHTLRSAMRAQLAKLSQN